MVFFEQKEKNPFRPISSRERGGGACKIEKFNNWKLLWETFLDYIYFPVLLWSLLKFTLCTSAGSNLKRVSISLGHKIKILDKFMFWNPMFLKHYDKLNKDFSFIICLLELLFVFSCYYYALGFLGSNHPCGKYFQKLFLKSLKRYM